MKISIKNFVLSVIIGVFEEERKQPQDVHLDIDVYLDKNAAQSDAIENTLDYNKLIGELNGFAKTDYRLLETLVGEMASFIYKHEFVQRVRVAADKGKLYENVDRVVVSDVFPK